MVPNFLSPDNSKSIMLFKNDRLQALTSLNFVKIAAETFLTIETSKKCFSNGLITEFHTFYFYKKMGLAKFDKTWL